MSTRTKSNGASSRYVGRETEQRVARHLRRFWPESKRLVRTGFRNAHSESADEGDLAGVPFAVQIKGHKRGADQFVPGVALADIWEEANGQALACGLPFAVIIEKRLGCADVDAWFAWLPMRLVANLSLCAGMRATRYASAIPWEELSPYHMIGKGEALVRMNVRDFLALVKAAGVPMESPGDLQASAAKTGS